HRPRRWSLEVYSLVGVAASVARTFEFVLAWFPVGGATKMRAASVDHEQPFGISNNPDAILLLEFRIDSESEVRRIAESEDGAKLEDGAGNEEAQEHYEAGSKEPAH